METGSTQPRGRGRGGRTAERTRGSISELRSTATRGGSWKRRLVTTIAVIVALTGVAGPAAAQVLVTNLSEPSIGGYELGDVDFAQPFTTGTNASGYQLESISLNFLTGRSREHEPVYVYVYGDNGNGRPNDRDQIARPTINGATFEGPVTGVNKYTVRKYGRPAPFNASSVHLDANTQYWVFVWAGEDKTLVNVDDTGMFYTGAARLVDRQRGTAQAGGVGRQQLHRLVHLDEDPGRGLRQPRGADLGQRRDGDRGPRRDDGLRRER